MPQTATNIFVPPQILPVHTRVSVLFLLSFCGKMSLSNLRSVFERLRARTYSQKYHFPTTTMLRNDTKTPGTAELINSIEITIANDIFGTFAIAIVKRISQLLLLPLIRSSISIDFFFLFGICRF